MAEESRERNGNWFSGRRDPRHDLYKLVLVPMLSAAIGMFVSFKLLEYRLEQVEKAAERREARVEAIEHWKIRNETSVSSIPILTESLLRLGIVVDELKEAQKARERSEQWEE